MPKGSESKSLIPDWLGSLPAKTRRLLSSVGPWVFSQIDEISDKYSKHQLRQVRIEILKQAMSAEMATLAEARKSLLLRISTASDPTERVSASAGLRHVEEEVRRFGVYIGAFDYERRTSELAPAPDTTIPMDAVWLDRFDQFARRQNEPWRRDLLAKALVKEAEQPGIIGLRALWLIGTMEETTFHAFAIFLDLVSEVRGFKVIPSNWKPDTEIPERELPGLGSVTLGLLLYLLADTGLLLLDAEAPSKGEFTDISYGGKSYTIKVGSDADVVMLSPLGQTVSLLYELKFNQFALDTFEQWIKQLRTPARVRKRRRRHGSSISKG